MKKKTIYFAVPGFIVIFFVVFILFKENKHTNSELISAIPKDAVILTELTDFSKTVNNINSNNLIWKELTSFESFHHTVSQFQYIDSTLLNDKIFQTLFSAKGLIASHIIGKNKVEHLFVFSDNGQHFDKEINNFFNKYDSLVQIKKKKYDNVKINHLTYFYKNKPYTVSFCQYSGLILISYSELLIEKAIRQINSGELISKQSDFTKVAQTAGKNEDGNLYINNQVLPELLAPILNEEYQKKWKDCKPASWTELDIDLKNDIVLLNGFSSVGENNHLFKIFSRQQPQKLQAFSILPANAVTFLMLGISNFDAYQQDFIDYHKAKGTPNKANAFINKIKTTYDLDVRQLMKDVIDNEAGVVYLDEKTGDINANKYIIIRTKSGSIAEEAFSEAFKKVIIKKGEKLSKYFSKIAIDDETQFSVYKNPLGNFFENIFGDVFGGNDYNYITFYQNYLIAGQSKERLKLYLHYNVLNKTISTNSAFTEITDYLSNRGNVYFYSDVPSSVNLISNYVNKSMADTLKRHSEKLLKIRSIVYQLSADNDLLYNNFVCKYSDKFKEKPQTMWETLLDTTTDFKPAFVINHITNENEIFIQDHKHNCYLINGTGRILWKVKTDGKIKSKIYQVDYYKNGKLQLLFNTENQIYLIDRLGNPVENYPVELRDFATNGIAVFDYEKNKDYRIFVACANNKVYAYNLEGNILKGWNSERTDHPVTREIQYFRVKEKDYIVFADKLKIYILDRKGNERVKIEKHFPVSTANYFVLEEEKASSKARLVTTDTLGKVHFIYFDGSTETKDLGSFSSNHFFDYKDVDADGEKDFIYLDDRTLKIKKSKKENLFSHKFKNEITNEPIYFQFARNDRKIGVVSEQSGEIFLFNSNGEMYKGFPLKGFTPFSIGKLGSNVGKFNLIVGNNDNFLYNYTVH